MPTGSVSDGGTLLAADAAINLLLGLVLTAAPSWAIGLLGLPTAAPSFYARVLGGVLIGIGIALLLQRSRPRQGLGLGGAIAINLCGGLVVALWLLVCADRLPLRGQVFLWALVLVLVALSGVELARAVKD